MNTKNAKDAKARSLTLVAMVVLAVAATAAAARDLPLVEAVKRGDAAAVAALVKQSADVNAAEVDGTTALHWAAHRDDVAVARALIRAGANVNAANRYGVTPLHLAATNGSATMIEALLAAGAGANTALPEGETALMTAARTGKVDAIAALLAHGADVNARENWRGQTALMWAAAEGHAAAIATLVKAGADVHARSKGATGSRAPQPQTPESQRAAAPRPANAPAAAGGGGGRGGGAAGRPAAPLYTFTPLLFAVRAGHISAVRALVDAGASVNETVSDGTSALVLAILNAHFELAGFLLEQGADPNADAQGWTALHQLAWTRRPNFGRPPPPPVPTGNLASLDLARMLLDYGANPDAREKREPRDNNRNDLNRVGATPFLLAAKATDVDYMRLLVDYGADPLVPNVDGTTPLMVAAGVGIYKMGESPGTNDEALEAVKLAHELGGEINTIDANGDTALHGAALRGANNIVHYLVEKGVKRDYIAMKNKRDWSPLIIADGIFHISVFISQPETAALLRKLMNEGTGPSR
jgi:ankyrin repeat protein